MGSGKTRGSNPIAVSRVSVRSEVAGCAAGTYYYLGDTLGSVMALNNSAGGMVNTYAYEPYGAMTASSGSTANSFGYGGQQLERASGLYKMGRRYYDPTLARWRAQDLLAGGLTNPQSLVRYAAVLGDPIGLLDASGLGACGFLGGVCDAMGSAASSAAAAAPGMTLFAVRGTWLAKLAMLSMAIRLQYMTWPVRGWAYLEVLGEGAQALWPSLRE